MIDADFKVVGGKHVPGKLAADVEAADISPKHQLLAGRKLVTTPQSDERTDPVDIPLAGDGPPPRPNQPGGIQRSRQCQIDCNILSPVPRPSQQIDGGVAVKHVGAVRAAGPPPSGDLVGCAGLDYGLTNVDVERGVNRGAVE